MGSSLKLDVDESPLRQLQKIMAHLCRPTDLKTLYYDSIYGLKPLREEISRVLIDAGVSYRPMI